MANRVRAGINAAFSSRVDRSWFSALTDAEDEAEAAFNRHEAMAAMAEAEREANVKESEQECPTH